MKKLLFSAALLAALSALSCSDEDEDRIRDFIVESTDNRVYVNHSSTLLFTSGNKDYSYKITGDECVKVTLSDAYTFGAVVFEGVMAGETVVELTDKVIDKTVKVNVTVIHPGIYTKNSNWAVSVEPENKSIAEEIEKDARLSLLFTPDDRYMISRRDMVIAVKGDDEAYSEKYKITNETSDDQLILVLEPGSSDSRRELKMISGAPYGYGIQLYLAFFGLDTKPTRANIGGGGYVPAEIKLLFGGDVTPVFIHDYPDAEKITVLYEFETQLVALPEIELRSDID